MPFRFELRPDLVSAFAKLIGDSSSLHTDAEFARRTRFRRPVVHGLLPVTILLLRVIPERVLNGCWLRQLSCRFLRPADIGDNLEFTLSNHQVVNGLTSYRFNVLNAVDGSTVTTGSLGFTETGRSAKISCTSSAQGLFSEPLRENAFSIEDLVPGRKQALEFAPTSVVMRALSVMLQTRGRDSAAECISNTFDLNIVAMLPVSALIGMRLPGRSAIFTKLEVEFQRAVVSDANITLCGELKKILADSGRVQVGLEWRQRDQVVASGAASAIVSPPSPAGIKCKSLSTHKLEASLVGKVALVTGASRGIGEATVKLLAMHGAKVAVHYLRGAKDATAIVNDIRENGGTGLAICAELRDEPAIQRMFETVRQNLGEVDILVNNAVGDFSPKPFETLLTQDYLEEFGVSLFGMHTCCKLALPHMRAKRWGKIINLGSIVTEVPVIGQNKYITAKMAIVGYTRSLAAEVARDNVQVNVVVPSMTDTTLIAAIPQGLKKKLVEENPSGRLLQPLDVAKTIVFLASDWAASISGQKLVLNQGMPPFL